MRYNVTFTISKNNQTEKKFQVLESPYAIGKTIAKDILEKKFKGYSIEVLRTNPSTSALAE